MSLNEGAALLHYAAIHNRREVAEWLIAAGADIRKRSQHGHTPQAFRLREELSKSA